MAVTPADVMNLGRSVTSWQWMALRCCAIHGSDDRTIGVVVMSADHVGQFDAGAVAAALAAATDVGPNRVDIYVGEGSPIHVMWATGELGEQIAAVEPVVSPPVGDAMPTTPAAPVAVPEPVVAVSPPPVITETAAAPSPAAVRDPTIVDDLIMVATITNRLMKAGLTIVADAKMLFDAAVSRSVRSGRPTYARTVDALVQTVQRVNNPIALATAESRSLRALTSRRVRK